MAKISQKEWVLTKQALNQLLLQIDPNLEIAAQKYNEIRQKLVKFFDYQDCITPEDYADETINRVVKKIDEGEIIASENINKYFHSVGYNVLKEYRRKKHPQSLEGLSTTVNLVVDPHKVKEQLEQKIQKEQKLECLDICLQKMDQSDSELIYQYYQQQGREGIENREAIAQRIGVPIAYLRVKMRRLREKLEQCVNNCLTI